MSSFVDITREIRMFEFFEVLDNNDFVWWCTIGVIVLINVLAVAFTKGANE